MSSLTSSSTITERLQIPQNQKKTKKILIHYYHKEQRQQNTIQAIHNITHKNTHVCIYIYI